MREHKINRKLARELVSVSGESKKCVGPHQFTGRKRRSSCLFTRLLSFFSSIHRNPAICPHAFATLFLFINTTPRYSAFLYQGPAASAYCRNPRALMATIGGALFVLFSMIICCNAGRRVPEIPNPKNVTSPGPSSLSTIVESLQFMFPQNYARFKVGEFPLVWDWKVESYARWWAAQRKLDCNMTHSHGPYGENIFWGSGQAWTPLDAVRFWVDEKQYYSYDTNSCEAGQMCGHYTQVVWRGSSRLGCARVVCDNGDVFMTCNYDPPGNYIGEKPY